VRRTPNCVFQGHLLHNGGVRGSLDLNADVGEGFANDEELFALITSANVACGFHAGNSATMETCCRLAVDNGVAVGAQVSYRDRAGFGRRDVEIGADALLADVEEQLAALRQAASAAGGEIRYIKAHGALYNRIVWDAEQAGAVVAAARRHGLPILGLPGGCVLDLAVEAGLPTFREFFADRGYTADGRLVPRAQPDALVAAAADAAARVVRMADAGVVRSVEGIDVAVEADSVCVHGDAPGVVSLARAVREALEGAGCVLRPFA
jgi:5-oxoprolinase (ATP-hydrolysing) subunit A